MKVNTYALNALNSMLGETKMDKKQVELISEQWLADNYN